MGKVTIGLKGIKFAPLAADGGPGTVFEAFGFTSPGSFSFGEEDPTKITVTAEEVRLPIYTKKVAGARSLTFRIPNPDLDALKRLRGGTISGTADKRTYKENDPVSIQGTIQIFPEDGFKTIQYNAVDAFAKFEGGLGSDKALELTIMVDVMQPTKTGVDIMEILE